MICLAEGSLRAPRRNLCLGVMVLKERALTKRQSVKRQSVKKRKIAKTDKKTAAEKTASALSQHFHDALGSTSKDVRDQLILQSVNALGLTIESSKYEVTLKAMSVASLLQEIKPQDGPERLLATQMVATHNIAMDCYRRAMLENLTFAARDVYLKHAAKLAGLFARQLETLNKHRGKGQQKMTIEHVNVAAGGQAIVGNVDTARREETAQTSQGEQRSISYNPAKTINLNANRAEPVRVKKKRKAER